MNLLIVSHTEHYFQENKLVGWGPTVREINHLCTSYSKIYHIACLYENQSAPKSSLPYENQNIKFVPIKPSGGKRLLQKVSALKEVPYVIRKVEKYLNKVDAVQIRVPTGFANYLLPWLSVKRPHVPVWVKYAGNWAQDHPPLGYQFQRWWLIQNYLKCKVTINGKWSEQPPHCISFENPCLDQEERQAGLQVLNTKQFEPPYRACFIGRIESAKGVGRILEAANELSRKGIKEINFIGEGPRLNHFIEESGKISSLAIHFYGALPRNEVAEVLKKSHFLLLPSTASEGFPKVIAEAWNYGVVPIVSNISAIPHYVSDSNGYLWKPGTGSFPEYLKKLDITSEEYFSKARRGYQKANAFTFSHYANRIEKDIFKIR